MGKYNVYPKASGLCVCVCVFTDGARVYVRARAYSSVVQDDGRMMCGSTGGGGLAVTVMVHISRVWQLCS